MFHWLTFISLLFFLISFLLSRFIAHFFCIQIFVFFPRVFLFFNSVFTDRALTYLLLPVTFNAFMLSDVKSVNSQLQPVSVIRYCISYFTIPVSSSSSVQPDALRSCLFTIIFPLQILACCVFVSALLIHALTTNLHKFVKQVICCFLRSFLPS